MKKVIGLLFLFSSLGLSAQYVRPGGESNGTTPPPPPPGQPASFWNKISIGGGFGLQFGTYTYVGLSPLINYHLTDHFMIGAGPIYQYEHVDDPYFGTYSSSTYGGRIAGTAFLPGELSRVMIMAEYDIINIPVEELNSQGYVVEVRSNLGLPIVGIGYKEPVSNKLFFYIYIFRDLSNNPASPYYTGPGDLPFQVSAGFDVGLGI